ncbi:MAG: phosphoenolpyruvate synthase, partial [Candidatus Sungbacteria bacterium]|nr:phosphoenolpyruvate synthase [Candidatus Sungbacteria bacterium]
GRTTQYVPVPKHEQLKPALTNDEILEVARCAICIEEHYGKPMDIEFAKDGLDGNLYIVQARPVKETEAMKKAKAQDLQFDQYILDEKNPQKILRGERVCDQIVTGRVHVIPSVEQMEEFREGEILVTEMTKPTWEPIMHKAKAIITDGGARKCHAGIIASNDGIPCIVGTGSATRILQDGQIVTVDCSQGETGFVYEGGVPFHTERVSFKDFEEPETNLMLFVDKPEGIFGKFRIPARGVGLARTEFMITEGLHKIHPMAWIKYPDVPQQVKEAIDRYASHYEDKSRYFVDRLAEAWGRIGATFYPRPVIMRFSDFKSDEYDDLIGAREFDMGSQPNPMSGIRGAVLYLHPNYAPAFRLECAAVKKAREEFGFTNIIPMIPFCRTPKEGQEVLAIMKECGLERGRNGLQVYVMVEINSNAILADQFAEIFDGGSIGSNDFVFSVFSADVRGVPWLAQRYNENHEAVRRQIKHA